MNKLLYFFKTHNTKCEYIGKFKKLALKKDNTLLNYQVEVERYKVQHENNIYILEHKKCRPQYILMNDKILINAPNQHKFIERFKKIEKVEKIKDVVKEKIQGTAFRMLRHYLNLNKRQLGQSIRKSELTIMRYEDASLALQTEVVLAVLSVHNLKLSVYIDIFKKVLENSKAKYSINDFYIINELKIFYERYGGVAMADFLTVEEVSAICKVKQKKAYNIMKEINDEMKKKGYIVIRGRVNRKFFNEKLGISEKNTDKKGVKE